MDELRQQRDGQPGEAVEPLISLRQVADLLVASIRYQGDLTGCEALFENLRQVADRQICGPALCLHYARDSQIECCYPVRQAVESEMVHSQRLPGGEVLSLVHCGPCSRLGESWERLFDYIERNNISVEGPWREIYLDGRMGGTGERRIELQAPLLKDWANGQ